MQPAAGGACAQHAGQHREPAEQRRGVDADRDVLGDVAEALLVVGGRDRAGPGVVGDAVRGHVLVGTGHPVSRHRAEDDRRIDLAQVLEPQAQLGEHPRAHGLDHHVGIAHQFAIELLAGLGLEVERDALLAPVQVVVHQRDALDDGPGHLADVVALG
jgi:hypothetical protein